MSRKQKFSDLELWKVVQNHRDEFTSVGSWNEYAKDNSLPHAQTFIQRFGSWNQIKEKLDLEVNGQHRPTKYTRGDLISILEKHKDAFRNIYSWNKYALKHKLPTYNVFERNLQVKEIEEITGYKPNLSDKDVKQIVLKYFPTSPPTVEQWKSLSKEKKLPSSSSLIRRFGSWKTMKQEIYENPGIIKKNMEKGN